MSAAGMTQAMAITTPQASDFQRGDVPMPMELSGRRSRRRMIHKSRPAQANIDASRARLRAMPGCGATKWKRCETAMSENKEMQRPTKVAQWVAAGLRGSAGEAAPAEAALGDGGFMGRWYEAWGGWVPQKHGQKPMIIFSGYVRAKARTLQHGLPPHRASCYGDGLVFV